MCKRPFNRNDNLNTCIYKVSVYKYKCVKASSIKLDL